MCACSVDVGSGVGKAVVAVAMITPARAVGLEIVAERAERAAAGLAEAVDRGLLSKAEAARAEVRQADALLPDAIPLNTSYAYVSNLCFSDELNRGIVAVLRSLPRLRCVASLAELPQGPVAVEDDGAQVEAQAHAEEAEAEAEAQAQAEAEGSSHASATCKLRLVRTLRVPMSWDDQTRLYIQCCLR